MDGKTRVRLVASKTRVAPLKELSIPRLELMSARILAQLMDTIRVALQSQLEIDGVKFWLDSKTALSWIQNKGEWKQFSRTSQSQRNFKADCQRLGVLFH